MFRIWVKNPMAGKYIIFNFCSNQRKGDDPGNTDMPDITLATPGVAMETGPKGSDLNIHRDVSEKRKKYID